MKRALVAVALAVSFAILVAATAFVAREVDRTLTARMAELKDTTMKTLEAMAGRHITYASLSPSFLRYVEVRDLTIHDSSPSEAPLLIIRQVRVYYSLLHLLAGRDPADPSVKSG